MNSSGIVVLIIVGIVIMVLAALIAQTMENNRKERHRRALALQENARLFRTALLSIPANYLLPEMRQFLIEEIQRLLAQVKQLEPRNSQIDSQLQKISELAQQPAERQVDSLTPAFQDHMSGQKIRNELKQLVNTIARLHNEGVLEQQRAEPQLKLGKAAYALAAIDLGTLTAREMEHGNNAKAALVHWQNALKHLQKLHPLLNLSNRINFVRSKVEALEETVRKQAAEQGVQEAEGEQQAWQQFVDADQEDWKIKQDYE